VISATIIFLLFLVFVFTSVILPNLTRQEPAVIEHLTHYDWPDEIPNLQQIKCSDHIEVPIINYEKNANYVVFVTNETDDRNHLFLKNLKVLIYSNNCQLLNSFKCKNDETKAATSINSIDLYEGILIVNYHVGPHGGVIRRHDIDNESDKYFQVYYPPVPTPQNPNFSSPPEPIYTPLYQDKATWRKFRNTKYGFQMQYPGYLNIEQIENNKAENNISSEYVLSVTEETCGFNCVQLFKQFVFNLQVYDDITQLPYYDNENSLEEYVNHYFYPRNEEEYVKTFKVSNQKGPGYKVRVYKQVGTVRLYTLIYLKHKGKIFVINSNIPTITAKNYDKEFAKIIDSFKFL
jgi:hypothetical protein